jgi:hypothetical protein
MSELREPPTTFLKEDFTYFAFVVDGEVATILPMRTEFMPLEVAALSSDPKVIVLLEEQKDMVVPGYTHDESGFHPPSE